MSIHESGQLLWLPIFACLFSGALWSQTAGTGTLVGTVTDTSGAVIASARVSVVHTETSFSSQVVTSAEGSYYVPYLAPGTYRITVESPGFKRYVRDNFPFEPAKFLAWTFNSKSVL